MKKKKYEQPEIKVVEVGGETILAGSDTVQVTSVENPWTLNTEEDW